MSKRMFLPILACVFLFCTGSLASSQDIPETITDLYKFKGIWVGEASLTNVGEPTITGEGYQYCRIVAGGWGLQCTSKLTSEELTYNEGVMAGYDVASDLVNWSCFNSFGQAFTWTGQFTEPDTLVLEKSQDLGGGVIMLDHGTWHFEDENTLTLVNDISVGGQVVTEIRLRMTRIGRK
ncbi:MAG: hypothetical protein WGN25_01090 [Candidatus Electrothrix sp. GW3-4]|uniref:hypothetical protein n=1 Tax=Candidatus Electrothrix sp. GW3-4 TaxID=3126740 RepID=UPI0030D3360A